MHDDIIRFSIDGETTDANLEARKEQLVQFVETQMRDEGVLPSLDLWPGFTLDYDAERDVFKFSLSVYGVYVGRDDEQLWDTAGVTRGRRIMKSIPTHKLKAS